jgi:hypothetical protein
MKIIAKGIGGCLIVEATPRELAQVLGFGSEYSLKDADRELAAGREIKVNDLWTAIEVQRSHPKEIEATARKLRALADSLDGVNKTIPVALVPLA